MNKYNYKPGSFMRHWLTENIPLKALHHLRTKLRQLFCLHGDYLFMYSGLQSQLEKNRIIHWNRGCKKCGWITPSFSLPSYFEQSYDRTALRIFKEDREARAKLTPKDGEGNE